MSPTQLNSRDITFRASLTSSCIRSPWINYSAPKMTTAHAPADPAVKYVLSIDQGTTSSRAIIFDHRGSVVSMFQKEHKQIFPQSAWVEHNAEEIFDNVCSCVTGALAQVHLHASNLVSVGITNQRETVVVWDKATVRSTGDRPLQ